MGLIAGIGAVLFAQQLTVAVSTFEARGGLTKDDGDAITDLFISALVADGTVKVVNRSSFDKILAEMKFQASDWTNNERVVQLGKALNATSIIQGSVMTVAGQTAVTTTILDLNTAQIISSSTLRMKEMSEIFDKLPAFVKDLMGNLPKPRETKEYKVGDRGPAGGFVFYDKGDYANGWRYLEAAPLELEFQAVWGGYYVVDNRARYFNVDGTHTVVGSGKRNTQFILEAMIEKNAKATAVQICNTLNSGGYRDWFLPSKDELDLIYKNLKQKGLGGFSNGNYWSSSQSSNRNRDYGSIYDAYYQSFNNGGQSDTNKFQTYSVRAIRQF